MSALSISLDWIGAAIGTRPITFGVPFPAGALFDGNRMRLLVATSGDALPLQKRALAHWPDGSVHWLLIDTLLTAEHGETSELRVEWDEEAESGSGLPMVENLAQSVVVDSGAVRISLPGQAGMAIDGIPIEARSRALLGVELHDQGGVRRPAVVSRVEIEDPGPVRSTATLFGEFAETGLRMRARFSAFSGTALLRVDLTLANPRRARHRRGTWDLGDPGSILFRDLSVCLRTAGDGGTIRWNEQPDATICGSAASLEIYQASSGGPNWDCSNHCDAEGRVPLQFRGYRVRSDDGETTGLRAQPTAGLALPDGGIATTVEYFWQNFPKAIEATPDSLRLRLFPDTFGEPFELQGGEQKTHTLWFDFDAAWDVASARGLGQGVAARAPADWYASCGVEKALAVDTAHPVLFELLEGAVSGPNRLSARREIIDEYGWRNFGDLFADHEGRYYRGPAPVVSHYNNQYDVICGGLLQYLWSGNAAWREIADPLARHVMDVDLYTTREDRPAYNGGLFWHTDHYLDASTCTHRSYASTNRPSPLSPYGGGPGPENNYTSGLMLFHYLTGDPRAREAVIQLSNWVIDMDDGAQTLLGLVDEGPTGLATRTAENDYHGPGRAAANSLNALLDGWLLTQESRYLDKAEEIVRRVVHPEDDIEDNQLDDIERRWSYLLFLRSLHRYLELKHRYRLHDETYDYARASILHYGRWMLENETPYFDRLEQLEYPTEAWPTLDIVKANVLRAIASHAESGERDRLASRGDEIAAQAWKQLAALEHRDSVRALSHLVSEGLRDAYWKRGGAEVEAAAAGGVDFGPRRVFETQRARVLRKLGSLRAWPEIARRLTSPSVWRRVRLGRP